MECDYRRGFELDIGFSDHSQVVTINNSNTTAISTLYKITPSLFQFTVCLTVVAW
jgi:hypothetical protein